MFFNAPEQNGQLHITSADFSGNQHDELRSNLPDKSVLPGFTYAYDQLSSAVYVALEKFNENHAVLSNFPLRVILTPENLPEAMLPLLISSTGQILSKLLPAGNTASTTIPAALPFFMSLGISSNTQLITMHFAVTG